MSARPVRREAGHGVWEGVEVLRYKEEGTAPFKDVTRQVLFRDPTLACELRYFEVGAGGHTTLERHEHTHAVMILHGRGRVLVGERIHAVAAHDLVHIPPRTWHQFRAEGGAPLGFLCMVNAERDRPELPSAAELAALRRDPEVAAFIRV